MNAGDKILLIVIFIVCIFIPWAYGVFAIMSLSIEDLIKIGDRSKET